MDISVSSFDLDVLAIRLGQSGTTKDVDVLWLCLTEWGFDLTKTVSCMECIHRTYFGGVQRGAVYSGTASDRYLNNPFCTDEEHTILSNRHNPGLAIEILSMKRGGNPWDFVSDENNEKYPEVDENLGKQVELRFNDKQNSHTHAY